MRRAKRLVLESSETVCRNSRRVTDGCPARWSTPRQFAPRPKRTQISMLCEHDSGMQPRGVAQPNSNNRRKRRDSFKGWVDVLFLKVLFSRTCYFIFRNKSCFALLCACELWKLYTLLARSFQSCWGWGQRSRFARQHKLVACVSREASANSNSNV